jgi:sugar-specific transcriptional regulator TrmB
MQIDLTPFGFTPTESLAYGALLGLGPASGYGVAKELSIARANAYQALDGLVAKRAATLLETAPRRYRAVHPRALLAVISDAAARKLDHLEQQVAAGPALGADAMVRLNGTRAIRDVATRGIVRSEQEVRCVAPGTELQALAPAFRARAAAGRATSLWSLGAAPDPGVPISAEVEPTSWQPFFSQPVLLLLADGALLATLGESPSGYWSTDPLVCGALGAAITAVIG